MGKENISTGTVRIKRTMRKHSSSQINMKATYCKYILYTYVYSMYIYFRKLNSKKQFKWIDNHKVCWESFARTSLNKTTRSRYFYQFISFQGFKEQRILMLVNLLWDRNKKWTCINSFSVVIITLTIKPSRNIPKHRKRPISLAILMQKIYKNI